jgi:release factor glutamine methyltransferase
MPLRILDIGTGSGILAIVCASLGHSVTATDINPIAVECANRNAVSNRVTDRLQVRHGDLFAPVAAERFDLILWNPPFFEGKPGSRFDLAWRSTDAIERLANNLRDHLSEHGRALLIWSSHRSFENFERLFLAQNLLLRTNARYQLDVEELAIIEITAG